MPELSDLQSRLGFAFQDESLLALAITHPSVAYEAPDKQPHNQRLEFLGDAVLGLILSAELYDKFPEAGEGPMTKARAHLVNQRSLANQARVLGLGGDLVLSKGEESNGGRDRASSLADVYEAIVGAMFLDQGYLPVREFVLRCFGNAVGELTEMPSLDNPKGELQEWLQARSSAPPRYEVTSVEGPDHDRVFECAVLQADTELARGRGKSKKEAESEAAFQALEDLRQREPSRPGPLQGTENNPS